MKTVIKIGPQVEGELNGRLLFFIDRVDNPGDPMLYKRSGFGLEGCPVFGVTLYGLQAGDEIDLSEQKEFMQSWPFSFDEIPHEKLMVQAFFIRYHHFRRTTKPSIWGMKDYGGGGWFTDNPFNLYSKVKTVNYGKANITLVLDQEIQPKQKLLKGQVYDQGNFRSHDNVQYFKMKSKLLSDFWGEDVYIGANILLPKNYDRKKKYPVVYVQGHYPGSEAPYGYGNDPIFTKNWDKGKVGEMILITFRDANMFFDDSYHVNSDNLGPYGDALIKEVIPALEKKYGGIGTAEGRSLVGGSTGGWEAMALQLFYPDFFGGSWPMFPDSMDFHYYQVANLYDEDNIYYTKRNWIQVEKPGARETDGRILWTFRQEHYYELAIGGDLCHSLNQYGIYQALFSPCGEDGLPLNAYDPISGQINKEVVAYWKEHYDLNAYLEAHHEELMPKLKGKIHLRGGDMDNFYLNLGIWAITQTLEKYDYQGYSKTFKRVGHDGNISSTDLFKEIGKYMKKQLKKKAKTSKK